MNEITKVICNAIFSIYDIDENQKKEIHEKLAKLSEGELNNLANTLVKYKKESNALVKDLKDKLQMKVTNLKEYKERKEAFYEAENLIDNI